MKATWCRDNEYSEMYENAESFGADKLAGPRALWNGFLMACGILAIAVIWWRFA